MIIYKIKYAGGMLDGYFIETDKGFIKVNINEGEVEKLNNIISKDEIRINQDDMRIEVEDKKNGYIN